MRIISLVTCLLFFSIPSHAQSKKDRSFFRFGLRNVSVRGENIGLQNNIGLKPVIDLGFGLTYNLSDRLRFQPGIQYSPRGFNAFNKLTDSTFVENTFELHYLDICPNFSYSFGNFNTYRTRLVVWGGPYLGIGIGGKNFASGTILNKKGTKADSTFNNTKFTFGNGLNRIDYGFNVGVGVQVEKFTQIGVAYSMGFNNIADNKNFNVYNQSIGFYLTVLFDDMF
jgi:long-subunit fatty acid transport protein